MTSFNITAVINAHREGLLAVPTLKSVENAVASARRKGLSLEVIAVLDRPDELTRNLFSEWIIPAEQAAVCCVEYGDLGLSRNHAVSLARGQWIAFLDADDLWSDNWLIASIRAAEAENRLSVWHPETNLYFGVRPHIFMHIDMDDPTFDVATLAEVNCWTALCFTSRTLLTQIPYRETSHGRQIGYEDWSWNIETISRGVIHKVVAQTAHAVRVKPASLVSQTNAARCLPHPSMLFRSILDQRQGTSADPLQNRSVAAE